MSVDPKLSPSERAEGAKMIERYIHQLVSGNDELTQMNRDLLTIFCHALSEFIKTGRSTCRCAKSYEYVSDTNDVDIELRKLGIQTFPDFTEMRYATVGRLTEEDARRASQSITIIWKFPWDVQPTKDEEEKKDAN